MDVWSLKAVFMFLILYSSASFLSAQLHELPNNNIPSFAKVSSSWTNNNLSTLQTANSAHVVRIILLKKALNHTFVCGFFYVGEVSSSSKEMNPQHSFVFAVVLLPSSLGFTNYNVSGVRVAWSANRNKPVSENATVQLTQDGNLILRDVDGRLVWSTNTSSKSVSGMQITESGNLVLTDEYNTIIWQSFDHPTDVLLPGQKLIEGQRLTARVSERNFSEGNYSFAVTPQALLLLSETPKMYYEFLVHGKNLSTELNYVRYVNGSLSVIPEPNVSTLVYMRLDILGHLLVHRWNDTTGWNKVSDILIDVLAACGYPYSKDCGSLKICLNGQCKCPAGFTKEERSTNDKCSENSPLSCQSPDSHSLVQLGNVGYFDYVDYDAADMRDIDLETCQQACLKNCSCKVALFLYGSNLSAGNCILPSRILSLVNNGVDRSNYNLFAFMKMQLASTVVSSSPARKKIQRRTRVLVASLAIILAAVIVVGIWFAVLGKKKITERQDDCLDHVPGMPTRFSYCELKAATKNFHSKIGEGGFGTVFEGTLQNGLKVAVKRLEGFSQGKKEFLAEVMTIGSIHHVNLVRLIGVCAENSHRLLVYEYVCNGSLDKWIFHRSEMCNNTLDWQTIRKIIVDIAKGLAYLHEDCSQKIIHLDIKPQNILLDKNFNAKVSDFGLSKLLERDESHVITTMRGTPGYMAPEWLSSVITEKVDVYSFGVVVMEIVCGRRNLDRFQSEENMHLLSLVGRKAEEDRLIDMVDKHSDMQLHVEEVVRMILTAIWCLQSDFTRRPSMAMVVKVLDGTMNIEPDLDYTFWTPLQSLQRETELDVSTSILPSILSGPR